VWTSVCVSVTVCGQQFGPLHTCCPTHSETFCTLCHCTVPHLPACPPLPHHTALSHHCTPLTPSTALHCLHHLPPHHTLFHSYHTILTSVCPSIDYCGPFESIILMDNVWPWPCTLLRSYCHYTTTIWTHTISFSPHTALHTPHTFSLPPTPLPAHSHLPRHHCTAPAPHFSLLFTACQCGTVWTPVC